MYAHMGRILQDNYPEIVKRTFIVNGKFLGLIVIAMLSIS